METAGGDILKLRSGDALIIVDVQKDFLPGGNLAVPRGDEIIPVLNGYIAAFQSKGLPVFATRDWHPPKHCSFKEQGGPWPPHCIANSDGARFASDILLPPSTVIISKDTEIDADTYSGFQGTELDKKLRSQGIKRLFLGGLATDYCVLNTVKDALKLGYSVKLLGDAVRAVNVQKYDGRKAFEEMSRLGAQPITIEMIGS